MVKELETFPVIIIDIVFKSYRVALTCEILRPKSPFSYLKIFERQQKKKISRRWCNQQNHFRFLYLTSFATIPNRFYWLLSSMFAWFLCVTSKLLLSHQILRFINFVNLKCSKSLEFHVRIVLWFSPHTHLTLPLTSLFTFTSHLHCVASNCAISVVI